MLGIVVAILGLLFSFVVSWKREGITQAILHLISLVSIYFAFFDPFNNTMRHTIHLPALIIVIVSITLSIILWRRTKSRR